EKMIRGIVTLIQARYKATVDIVIRMDAGFFDEENFRLCDELGIGFVGTGKTFNAIKEQVGAIVSRRKVDGKNYSVLTWSPKVKSPSGQNYVINGYVNEQNNVDRVETWLGENIMGDMHILATYTGWKDFGGVMAPSKIVQTR